jgi:uncharacterized membrane protein YbhN (UPF0104 family)
VWLLHREHGVPLSRSAGIALGEKVLDGVALLVLVLPIPWLLPNAPVWTGRAVAGLGVLSVPALTLGWWLGRRNGGTGWGGAFLRQVRILREPRALAGALVACLGTWLADLASLWASMRAVGLVEGFAVAAFALLVINAALAVPSTPGNLGVLETGGVLAFTLVGIPRPTAAACALLYHAIQLGPVLLLALLDLRLVLGLRATSSPTDARAVEMGRPAAESAIPPHFSS